MKNKAVKIIALMTKILNNEFPRFVGGQDLLEICLSDLRQIAAIEMINDNVKLVNAVVTIVDKIEPIASDFILKEKQAKFYKANYVPMCVCNTAKAAELLTHIKCEACELAQKKVA